MSDFIAHPEHGIAALTEGQKLHLRLRFQSAKVSLAACLMRDGSDDDMPPPAAPPVPARLAA